MFIVIISGDGLEDGVVVAAINAVRTPKDLDQRKKHIQPLIPDAFAFHVTGNLSSSPEQGVDVPEMEFFLCRGLLWNLLSLDPSNAYHCQQYSKEKND
jgi:hypothetical protein